MPQFFSFELLQTIYYNTFFKLFLQKRPKYDRKYRISICCIFKDEASFLREWIEYHLMIGFDHIYLYDNNSTDNYLTVLRPYFDTGKITLTKWPKDFTQMEAYQECLTKYRTETQWLAWLDVDEFFVPRYSANINEWIKSYEKYPSILVWWKMFGTGGKWTHDFSKTVIEQYTVCHQGYFLHRGKCLINTDYDVARWDDMTHHLTLVNYPMLGFKLKAIPVDVYKHYSIGATLLDRILNAARASAQINHYWTKAWNIYERTRRKTDVLFPNNPKRNMNYFYSFEKLCISVDYTIFRFLMELKFRLKTNGDSPAQEE